MRVGSKKSHWEAAMPAPILSWPEGFPGGAYLNGAFTFSTVAGVWADPPVGFERLKHRGTPREPRQETLTPWRQTARPLLGADCGG